MTHLNIEELEEILETIASHHLKFDVHYFSNMAPPASANSSLVNE